MSAYVFSCVSLKILMRRNNCESFSMFPQVVLEKIKVKVSNQFPYMGITIPYKELDLAIKTRLEKLTSSLNYVPLMHFYFFEIKHLLNNSLGINWVFSLIDEFKKHSNLISIVSRLHVKQITGIFTWSMCTWLTFHEKPWEKFFMKAGICLQFRQ